MHLPTNHLLVRSWNSSGTAFVCISLLFIYLCALGTVVALHLYVCISLLLIYLCTLGTNITGHLLATQTLHVYYTQGWPEPYIYIYLRCIHGMLSRKITIHTVIYGVHIWFWPTLTIHKCTYLSIEARTLMVMAYTVRG
jgi:hypothetical protein